jgi:hypothetical protein
MFTKNVGQLDSAIRLIAGGNVGQLDRAIRLIAGGILTLAGLFLLGGLRGSSAGIDVTILGVWMLITGISGRCLSYAILGISTQKKEAAR